MSLHEFSETVLHIATGLSLAALTAAFLLIIYRIWRGPALPDRVLGLDLLTSTTVCFIGVIAIDTGFTLYVDVAIALGLVGFLATVAFARFILAKGRSDEAVEALGQSGRQADEAKMPARGEGAA
ncbi:cation:proton antiporter [Consotaella aegiceratis]|uniref:cation:proton antiporter n=1 Tax=Consotaella aegiceratis TaxID=3097961 RepID=UPI002F407B9D